MMKVNPFQVIGMIKNGQNPQQIIMNLLEQQNSSPMYKSLKNMIHNNKIDEIEDFARNYVNSQGGDFDRDFNAFKKNIGL